MQGLLLGLQRHPTVPPLGTFYAGTGGGAVWVCPGGLAGRWLPFELLASGGQKLSEDENLAFNECGLVSTAPRPG